MRRWTVRVGLAMMGLSVLAGVGCKSPCDALAERTCGKVGEDAPLCKKARKYADGASPAERATCERVLKVVEEFVAE